MVVDPVFPAVLPGLVKNRLPVALLQFAGHHEINNHEHGCCYKDIGDKHAEPWQPFAHFFEFTLSTYFCFHCVPTMQPLNFDTRPTANAQAFLNGDVMTSNGVSSSIVSTRYCYYPCLPGCMSIDDFPINTADCNTQSVRNP